MNTKPEQVETPPKDEAICCEKEFDRRIQQALERFHDFFRKELGPLDELVGHSDAIGRLSGAITKTMVHTFFSYLNPGVSHEKAVSEANRLMKILVKEIFQVKAPEEPAKE